ncbi:hypothetical protein N836_03555 [Leptolyngbya sp. Heron Island J]|uniref:FHA domain-containing protein n=1 Tax=Leptolyngbya sp. Heron Island J TaxID=1385935 RepID=UPI0003B98632|nr:FHA domain-containing protein [Leptolyngbya sp. Heron Island J]ESA37324.1 hypothetical protein N836_03555 [Leptolyngbya sp. Heron Island J]
MTAIEICEPGIPASRIKLKDKVDENGRVTIGRSVDEPGHLSFRKAPAIIGKKHCTLEFREGESTLWVRDGKPLQAGWTPSRNGTFISTEGQTGWVRVPSSEWRQFAVGDVLRFCNPNNIEASGFLIRHSTGSTEETLHGSATCSAAAIDVWRSESIISDDGLLLIRVIKDAAGQFDGALIVKTDLQAEKTMGYQPGDLTVSENNVLLDSLVDRKDMLASQVQIALRQSPPAYGRYMIKGKLVDIVMSRRYVGGEHFLLAWLKTSVEVAQVAHPWSGLATLGSQLLDKSPILFSVVASLIAIAIIVLSLM